MSFNNFAIHFWYMSKYGETNIKNNSNLVNKKGVL